jgi:all-trans-retinol 13,14-reductase
LTERRYGLVVVGGGITGLSAALAWALNVDPRQRPVLVLEKQPRVGGYVTSFKREGFLFDTAQFVPDPTDILEYFGVDIELKRFAGNTARIFIVDPATGRSTRIEIPSGSEAFERMLAARYPERERGIRRLLAEARKMYGELIDLKVAPGALARLRTVLSSPRIALNQGRTFLEYLARFGRFEGELLEVFDVFAAFCGLPCGRVAAIMAVAAMMSSLNGAFRPREGFIKLPHGMRRRLEGLGGEVRTRARVEKILVEGGRVRGVRLAGGEVIGAENVVTTVDTQVAMRELVGLEEIRRRDPAYADKVESVRMSPASMTVSLGLDDAIDLAGLGMDCGYNVITTGKGAFERLFREFDAGRIGFDDACFHIAAICPSLTTGGRPSLILRGVPMPIADWADLRERRPEEYGARKTRWADYFIGKVERHLVPELRKHIVAVDIATPATFARYSGSPTGSNYDMSPYPSNFGGRRLKMRTPIAGLYLPKFSHGILSAMHGGLQAADMILEGAVMGGCVRLDLERAVRLRERNRPSR